MTKKRLLSFAEYAKDAQPEVLVTLIQTIVEKIYIGFFRTAGYIEDNLTSVCDSEQYCICTQISQNGDIWTNQSRYWSNLKKVV